MKNKVTISLICAAAFMGASCTSIRHTATTVPVESQIRSFTVAEMDVNPKKLSRTTSWNFNPFKRVDVDVVKSNTTAELLQDVDADVLVEPEYIVNKRGFLRGGSVTVIGFPAKYKNFHTMTAEEAAVIKATGQHECKKDKKKKRFLLF